MCRWQFETSLNQSRWFVYNIIIIYKQILLDGITQYSFRVYMTIPQFSQATHINNVLLLSVNCVLRNNDCMKFC